MLVMAVSLPAGRPLGQLLTEPSTPRRLIQSKVGRLAYSSGVLPPSSGTGLSAMPSPINNRYFIYFVLLSRKLIWSVLVYAMFLVTTGLQRPW